MNTTPYTDADNRLAEHARQLANQATAYAADIIRGGPHTPAADDLVTLARQILTAAKRADAAAEQRRHGGQSRPARSIHCGWQVLTEDGWSEIDMLSTYGGVVRIKTDNGHRFQYDPAAMVLCRTEREARTATTTPEEGTRA